MTCQFCDSPLKLGEDEVFTCGSFTWKGEWRRSAECQLGEKILKLTNERDELKAINHSANLDWADDDTRLREMCQKVGIPQSLIDGDTHYVPHIVGLGELLVQKIESVTNERDTLKAWIEGLSFWEWNPNQFEHQVVVPLEPGEHAYVGNRKPEGLK